MKRSNKLKVPPAVRLAARQAAASQEIKGLGKPKLQVTDGVSAAKMREQFRVQKRTKWLWQEGDMVRFRDYQTGTNQMGMVVAFDTYHETLSVTSPLGLRTLNCREAKLMDRLDIPCDTTGE